MKTKKSWKWGKRGEDWPDLLLRDEGQGRKVTKYLGIEIWSLLHESTDGEPETVGQREVVAAGQHRLLAGHHDIGIVLVFTQTDLVGGANGANGAGQVVVAVVAPAAHSASVQIVVPFVRREAGHHPHWERDQDVGQQQEEPNLHGQRIHKREQPRRCRRRNLIDIRRTGLFLYGFGILFSQHLILIDQLKQ